MCSLSGELLYLIHQFLDDEKYTETMIKLEKETGFYFNMGYFEGLVINGEWKEADDYLQGFMKFDDQHSLQIFFELRKQKYLEALDRRDTAKAVKILNNDLKVFSSVNGDLFNQLALLLTLPNFRENQLLANYVDAESARTNLAAALKSSIEVHPLISDKLQFPIIENARLRTLINQSLNWQHNRCINPMQNPEIKSLFEDHTCEQPNTAHSTASNPMVRDCGVPVNGDSIPLQHQEAAQFNAARAGWMDSQSPPTPRQAFSVGPMGLNAPNNAGITLKHPRTPSNNPAMDYEAAGGSESVTKRARHIGVPEEVSNHLPQHALPPVQLNQSHGQPYQSTDDLPKTVAVNLTQGSKVKSMDFHPLKQTLLLVGTVTGEFSLWEVGSRERITSRDFKVWDLDVCSMILQASLENECAASVNKVRWSPDGSHFGVAYSKHIVQLYDYRGGPGVKNHLEIEAHVGSVNDLAFATRTNQLSVITCGDDKAIKVWDATSGERMFTLEGHDSPVYSVCSQYKEHTQTPFILSAAVDGKVRVWLFDNAGSRIEYATPGQGCISMVYTADGTRLFSCGANKDGESYIVEWNDGNGFVKKKYLGLGSRSVGVIHIDTTKNRFLAAGDEFKIKYWDMNDINMSCSIDADGGLPASPCIRFNKDGALLAVSTNANGIKILANPQGLQMICASREKNQTVSTPMASVVPPFGAARGKGIRIGAAKSSSRTRRTRRAKDSQGAKPLPEDAKKPSLEITEPSQLRSLQLPDNLSAVRIMRLTYTNSGEGIVALAYNVIHKLWKWQRNDMNATAKATTSVPPQFWQPASGIVMTNDITEANLEEAVPCFALSKNDMYLLSASGGKASLFNMRTFKAITTFNTPTPRATSVAFHPRDNNIIAIGMDDSSIYIHNVRTQKLNTKLQGHQKRVTGLAFSCVLNVLVSSGADDQLCVWTIDKWEKKASTFLQKPHGTRASNTLLQFHQDQTRFLVVNELQIAVYEALELGCIKQWVRDESSAPITDSTYSCDNKTIYTSFDDGSVCIFTSGLEMKCRINPMSYLSTRQSCSATAIAAHPTESNQFALGLADGSVHVLEPLETEPKWGAEEQ